MYEGYRSVWTYEIDLLAYSKGNFNNSILTFVYRELTGRVLIVIVFVCSSGSSTDFACSVVWLGKDILESCPV